MLLTDRWLAGWTASRRLRFETEPLRRVEVGDVHRELEYVGAEGDDLAALVAAVSGDPRTMLTLVGLAPFDAPPPLRLLTRDECLMTTRLAPIEAPDIELHVEREQDDGRALLWLWDGDVLAASGQVGLSGSDAVIDKIETTESHRRRGLARQVVADLTRTALDRGATDGLLIASVMGEPLYTGLGWERRESVQGFRGA